MSSPSSFASFLRRRRLQEGYSTAGQLAARTGLDQSTIWRLEKGLTKARPETLRILAPALGLSLAALLMEAGMLDEPASDVAERRAGYRDDVLDLTELRLEDRQKVRDFFNYLRTQTG